MMHQSYCQLTQEDCLVLIFSVEQFPCKDKDEEVWRDVMVNKKKFSVE